jgi:hypothetical protein
LGGAEAWIEAAIRLHHSKADGVAGDLVGGSQNAGLGGVCAFLAIPTGNKQGTVESLCPPYKGADTLATGIGGDRDHC